MEPFSLFDKCFQPFYSGRKAAGAGDEADSAMAEAGQMFECQGDAVLFIAADVVYVFILLQTAVVENSGISRADNILYLFVAQMGGGDNETVDIPLLKCAEDGFLFLGAVAGISD